MASPIMLPEITALRGDAAIIPRLAANDTFALSLIVEKYWTPLTRYAVRLLGDMDAAKDVSQEAFVRLWAGRGNLRSDSLRSFLYRIVHNLAVDELRKREVRARRVGSADITAWRSLPRDPAAIVEQHELGDAINRAIQSLPARRREVFILAYFHELSYQQVAAAVGISVATVKNHLAAALSDLRAALRPQLAIGSGLSD